MVIRASVPLKTLSQVYVFSEVSLPIRQVVLVLSLHTLARDLYKYAVRWGSPRVSTIETTQPALGGLALLVLIRQKGTGPRQYRD